MADVTIDIGLDTSEALNDISKLQDEVNNRLNRGGKKSATLLNVELQLKQLMSSILELQKTLEEVSTVKVETPLMKEVIAQADVAQKKLFAMRDAIIQNWKNAGVDKLYSSFGEMSDAAFDTATRTKEGRKLYEQLQEALNIQNKLIDEGKDYAIDTEQVDKLKEALSIATDRMGILLARHDDVYGRANNIALTYRQWITVFSGFKKILDGIERAFNKILNIVKKLATSILNVMKNMAKMLTISNKLSLGKGFKGLLRNVLRYGFGIRSLYVAFNKLRSYGKEALEELAKASPEVNSQMSALVTAFNRLKGSIGTAFQPILSIAIPILVKFCNVLANALNLIGRFIASITGQGFIMEAVAQQTDYAASLDKTGASAKKAKKELEGYLSPIDEINKYKSDKDSDSGAGGGAGGGAGYDYVKTPIEAMDTSHLGKLLGDKLAEMLAKIPWDNIKSSAAKLGRNIANFINEFITGEFEGQKSSTLLGKTIAQAINTAFTFLLAFSQDLHWADIGEFIGEAIMGFIYDLDWSTIQEAVDTTTAGIANLINEGFKTIKWSDVGVTLGNALNTVIYGAWSFISTLNFKNIGKSFGETFAEFLGTTDWSTAGESISKFVNGLLDAIIAFLQTPELGTKIATALTDLFSNMNLEETKEKLKEVGRLLLNILFESWNTLPEDFTSKATELAASIGAIFVSFKALQGAVDVLTIMARLMPLFTEGAAGANLLAGAVSAIKGAFSALAGPIGIIIGAIIILVEAFKHLWETNDEFKANILNTWEELKTNFSDFVTQMKSKLGWLGDVFKTFKEVITDAWQKLCDFLAPQFELTFKFVSDILDGAFDYILGALDLFAGIFTGDWDKFLNGLKQMLKGIINSIISIFEFAVNTIIEGLNFLQIPVPEVAQKFVGTDHIGFNISRISIPRLAQGAVIPPNKEFMAVLGDQKRGTNIETPLATMVEAFNQALAQNGGGRTEINFLLPNKQKLAQYVIEGGRVLQTSRGSNPFQLV